LSAMRAAALLAACLPAALAAADERPEWEFEIEPSEEQQKGSEYQEKR